EREVAGVDAAELLAVQPHLRAVVVALEADLPELASPLLGLFRRVGKGEVPAVPADVRLVLGRVGGVPVVGDPDRGPAGQIVLGVPLRALADERVVLTEVPGAAEQLAVHLSLSDERLPA